MRIPLLHLHSYVSNALQQIFRHHPVSLSSTCTLWICANRFVAMFTPINLSIKICGLSTYSDPHFLRACMHQKKFALTLANATMIWAIPLAAPSRSNNLTYINNHSAWSMIGLVVMHGQSTVCTLRNSHKDCTNALELCAEKQL